MTPLIPQPLAMADTLRTARRLVELGKTWTLEDARRDLIAQALTEAEQHVDLVLEALARLEERS